MRISDWSSDVCSSDLWFLIVNVTQLMSTISIDQFTDMAVSGEIPEAMAKYLGLEFTRPHQIEPEFQPLERTFSIPSSESRTFHRSDFEQALERYASQNGLQATLQERSGTRVPNMLLSKEPVATGVPVIMVVWIDSSHTAETIQITCRVFTI